MGPTAAGKTGLALELVRRFPMDIISVDSAMVYRGMDIGTAKPDAATLQRAPHRLVDIRDPEEPYSAAMFRRDALREMAEITAAGRVPLLVGGTMLYFRALLEGLSRLPAADPETRAGIERRAQRLGWPALHAELARRDPEAAARIDPNDPQRIQRALEVIALTGRSLTEAQRRRRQDPLPYRVLKLVACPSERAELHSRIARRFDAMLAEGFLDEVRALHARPGLGGDLPSMRAVGYRQARDWLEGRLDDAGLRDKAIAATRQLAKRQLTWLRREEGALWYDLGAEKAVEGVLETVAAFLESGVGRSQLSPHAGQ
jgi:tRNA dimethylallyltransferase